jgi:hypothetical protein
MVDEGVIHVISNSSDCTQTWCTAAKNSSRRSSMWVLFLHTIARVVSEHHSNAPAFSTPIDYRNVSRFLLSLLFSADKDPCGLRIPWISEIMYKSTKVLTEICSFCGYASACRVFIVAISVLESNPSSSKAIKREGV